MQRPDAPLRCYRLDNSGQVHECEWSEHHFKEIAHTPIGFYRITTTFCGTSKAVFGTLVSDVRRDPSADAWLTNDTLAQADAVHWSIVDYLSQQPATPTAEVA